MAAAVAPAPLPLLLLLLIIVVIIIIMMTLQVLARGGSVIAITEEGNHELDDKCESVIYIPRTEEFLAPLLSVVPCQLLAYYIADLRKCNVDQSRNLAKSVTVE